jgi:predicted nuclease of predicted toxin-antitoxin system
VRVLLDESLPHDLAHELTNHEVDTVAEVGWAGLPNGELLRRARDRFDVFVTMDQNLPYQQNLQAGMPVVLVRARSNRMADLHTLVPAILKAIPYAKSARSCASETELPSPDRHRVSLVPEQPITRRPCECSTRGIIRATR